MQSLIIVGSKMSDSQANTLDAYGDPAIVRDKCEKITRIKLGVQGVIEKDAEIAELARRRRKENS